MARTASDREAIECGKRNARDIVAEKMENRKLHIFVFETPNGICLCTIIFGWSMLLLHIRSLLFAVDCGTSSGERRQTE